MTMEFIKYAFVAGEVSPTLVGRSDLEKYDLGLRLAKNGFVDYRGGFSSRPGTEFVDYIQHDDKPTKFFTFKFAPNVLDTYVLLFGHNYIRFIQAGSYLLEGDQTITGVTQADPGVVTAVAHGYSTGDWVKIFSVGGMTSLNGRLFEVGTTTTDTFQLLDPFGDDFDTSALDAYTSGGVVNRVYTVTTEYDAEDLYLLRAHQSRNLVRLTHQDYPVQELVRAGEIDWSLTATGFGNYATIPDTLVGTASDTGDAGVAYAVTAVDQLGQESLASAYLLMDGIVNFTTAAGSVKVEWDAVVGAQSYNVYRSNVLPDGAQVSRAMLVGFVGSVFGPEFIDNNVVPDFAITPPENYLPFANGGIQYIEITAQGSGYPQDSVVSVTDAEGTGFVGYPVVNESGNVIAVVVVRGGEGYVSPTVSITGSGGTGATATAEIGEADGNSPGVANVLQQRQQYAGSGNQPLSLWGSRRRLYDNFDVSRVSTDLDSYEYDIDSEDTAPIRHLMTVRAGSLVFSESGVWLLTGSDGGAVSPLNAQAEPQSFTGCSLVPPLKVDTNILYMEGKGSTVRLLSYSDISKIYSGQDMSILSSHFFKPTNQITHWSYAQEPYKLVWARREDGSLLTFTIVNEQNVYAWSQNWTKGLFEDVVSIQEGNIDRTYVVVKRKINGRWTKMIEWFADRDFENVEDAWCVDCGLGLPATAVDAKLTIEAASGTDVEFTTDADVFSSGDVGKIIRAGGCKATIITYNGVRSVQCSIDRDVTQVIPEDDTNTPQVIEAGAWTMDSLVSTVSGLWHLEGQTVSILADGNVISPKTVTNGTISLGISATRVIIGLPFVFEAETLPPVSPSVVVEGRRKRIVGVAARVNQTRGLKVGTGANSVYEAKERTTEDWGEPIELSDRTRIYLVDADWTIDSKTYFRQDYPLPATILGLVFDLEVGDDTN